MTCNNFLLSMLFFKDVIPWFEQFVNKLRTLLPAGTSSLPSLDWDMNMVSSRNNFKRLFIVKSLICFGNSAVVGCNVCLLYSKYDEITKK
mmetsp:Transcript_32254/g.37611  ORF Transcript_32254/g.37611 Transcript_32254/m.37611 type:complete len:90 (+) Transcript_32254:1052-1321(+)